MERAEQGNSVQAPDRSVAPDIHRIERLELPSPGLHRLKNGVPVYEVHGGTQPAVRVELMFQAGIKYQERVGLAAAVNEVLKEGTSRKGSHELAEELEYYGISFEQRVDRDHAWLGFYILSKDLPPVLALLREILEEASFPEEEVRHYIEQQKDDLLEEREKVSFLAKQRFMPVLFGEDHPYGRSIENPELLEQLDREGIKGFYDEHYLRKGGISIILSGLTEPWMVEKLDEELGHIPIEGADREPFHVDPPRPSTERTHWVNKEGALQASLRIGKPLFSRQHPDFPGMVILTTLLGGYFGSRLMMNLREDKGYTYGVGAASIALQDSGFFAIATDVGGQVREAALEEALKEIRALSEKPVSYEELEHVRYYMQGSFLRSADGPFARAELFKRVHASGLGLSFYDRLMETLHTITPERLQELAREHLKEEEMRVVIAGDPSAPGS